jgi:hypothetical protein
MKVLSIDVGIKNLAYCLFVKDENADYFTISHWDSVNVAEQEVLICTTVDKKGQCDKPAKFKKDGCNYCLKHAKTQPKRVNLTKLKIQSLRELATKRNIAFDKGAKKQQLFSLLDEHMQLNCLQEIAPVNATKTDLVRIGRNIQNKFDATFPKDIDCVIIENQISPIASRMKTIQGMLAQYFIMTGAKRVEFVAASNKLKDCDAKDKATYKDRKRLGIEKCLELILTEYVDQIDYFDAHKKQDDLADSFLQGIWFIKDRQL